MKEGAIGFVVGATSVALAYVITKLDYKSSQWECNRCGINFRPPFKEYFFAPHTPKKRKLICPVCGIKDYLQCNRDFSKVFPKKKTPAKTKA